MANSRKKPPVRIVVVKRSTRLTPNMQRVTFTGDELIGFPTDRNGANFKLLIPDMGIGEEEFRMRLESGNRPTTRTYTVRDYRADTNELDVDFVAHGDEGPASRFALTCRAGDFAGVAGPGPLKLNRLDATWFLFCADMSALPAAAAAIEALPKTAKGVAFFEVTTAEDAYPITAPPGINVHWLIHPTPHEISNQQLERIKAIEIPEASLSIFAAGEHNSTMAIRDHILKERKIGRENAYISGYWKIGLIEDQHQVEKRKDT
ncbi:MAG: siderophore-interacting protein [Pseudomonadota bacterium]